MARLYWLTFLALGLLLNSSTQALPSVGKPGKPTPPKGRLAHPVQKTRQDSVEIGRPLPIEPLPVRLVPTSLRSFQAGPDPIRFTLRTTTDSVAVGEEIELTITADLLDISPQLMFFFEELSMPLLIEPPAPMATKPPAPV